MPGGKKVSSRARSRGSVAASTASSTAIASTRGTSASSLHHTRTCESGQKKFGIGKMTLRIRIVALGCRYSHACTHVASCEKQIDTVCAPHRMSFAFPVDSRRAGICVSRVRISDLSDGIQTPQLECQRHTGCQTTRTCQRGRPQRRRQPPQPPLVHLRCTPAGMSSPPGQLRRCCRPAGAAACSGSWRRGPAMRAHPNEPYEAVRSFRFTCQELRPWFENNRCSSDSNRQLKRQDARHNSPAGRRAPGTRSCAAQGYAGRSTALF